MRNRYDRRSESESRQWTDAGSAPQAPEDGLVPHDVENLFGQPCKLTSITPYISSSGSFMGAKTSSPPILCLAPRRRRELPAGFARDGPPQFFDRPHLVEPCRGGAIPPAAPTVPISTRSILRRAQEVLAKLEHFLRKAAERTAAATGTRIGTLLDDFSPAESENYFVNSGYASV